MLDNQLGNLLRGLILQQQQTQPEVPDRVDLPEAGAVNGLEHKLAVGALLDRGLHRHCQHRRAVLVCVFDHLWCKYGGPDLGSESPHCQGVSVYLLSPKTASLLRLQIVVSSKYLAL